MTADAPSAPSVTAVVLGVAAWSGTGKTTLLEALLPALEQAGVRVGVIKHAHHGFEVDKPGKDSHRLRQAGASPMLVASAKRYALMRETPNQEEADLDRLIELISAEQPDLILVEGFKRWPLPRLVLYREAVGDPSLLSMPGVQAVCLKACHRQTLPPGVARLDIDRIDLVAQWVLDWMQAEHKASTDQSLCR